MSKTDSLFEVDGEVPMSFIAFDVVVIVADSNALTGANGCGDGVIICGDGDGDVIVHRQHITVTGETIAGRTNRQGGLASRLRLS